MQKTHSSRLNKLFAFIRQRDCDMCWEVECHLHLSQAVEGEEGTSPYPCDAVALGNLTVAQRRGCASVGRLIALKTFHISRWRVWDFFFKFFFFLQKYRERHHHLSAFELFNAIKKKKKKSGTELIDIGTRPMRENGKTNR